MRMRGGRGGSQERKMKRVPQQQAGELNTHIFSGEENDGVAIIKLRTILTVAVLCFVVLVVGCGVVVNTL